MITAVGPHVSQVYKRVIGPGTLIHLAIPGKPRGPTSNLRPIVLNSIRKAISLIILKRISADVSHYLGPTQSDFRSGCSTADVVWTQRWIAAKASRYNRECHILGQDMSKAFDTISRPKLLTVMSDITGPDEVCLIHHPLYNTSISVKIGSSLTLPFYSTIIGTPQGDGLSPVLYICYLEAALQECRTCLPPRPIADMTLPHETSYADDISLYSTSKQWLDASLPLIANGLDKWSLCVNKEKTEWIRVTSASKEYRVSKQLGSLLGEEEDVRRRIEQASRTYGRMYSLWLRNHIIPEKIRLRLYSAIVLLTLLYNRETWGPTAVIIDDIILPKWATFKIRTSHPTDLNFRKSTQRDHQEAVQNGSLVTTCVT